jgi:hypothetical protein
MVETRYTLRDGTGQPLQVRLKRDKRLRKTLHWQRLPDGSLLVRVPPRMPKRAIGPVLGDICRQLDKITESYKRRTDEDLHLRAERINQKHFDGKIQWNAIRWVGDMHTRLGSCSQGGTTDGEIRISDKIKDWPEWVVDYVIAHELMHRKHPNHSTSFWSDLQAAYPLTERARGFIRGVGFADKHPMGDEAEE